MTLGLSLKKMSLLGAQVPEFSTEKLGAKEALIHPSHLLS
jgi:hypothetical protein